ncbi:MAG: hypothetical protein ABIR11_05070 [Candidatus Limnocylindrales bacterium]
MLFGYSERFFERIRTWTIVTLLLLVVAGSGIFPAAVIAVPFLVPFAFLETGYLFYYTVFARRHAEYLERAINERFGRDVLVAHRLEAAYFYPPDASKIAAISFARPLGMMSVMTIGYSAGAGLLWLVGMAGLLDLPNRLETGGFYAQVPGLQPGLPLVALAWTILIAGYLVWTSLARHDENRLLAELDASYGAPPEPPTD